jgi:GNAT superfamily N-acetyltransferase
MDLDPALVTGLYRVGEPRQQKPEITYQVETLAATRDEALPLLDRHYEEIAQFKDVQKLDPDWETYEALERTGKLWVMTVRDRGSMVGYIVMVINRNLHYKQLMMATEDIHFLLPAYRKGLIGYRMLAKAKEAMKARGCRMAAMRCKAGMSHAPLFERLGGELSDMVYAFKL